MTLTDFLLARIGEDEQTVRAVTNNGKLSAVGGGVFAKASRDVYSFNRILDDCEAKRRIVEMHSNVVPGSTIEEQGMAFCEDDLNQAPCPTLRLLALPYADHQDHRDEWRP